MRHSVRGSFREIWSRTWRIVWSIGEVGNAPWHFSRSVLECFLALRFRKNIWNIAEWTVRNRLLVNANYVFAVKVFVTSSNQGNQARPTWELKEMQPSLLWQSWKRCFEFPPKRHLGQRQRRQLQLQANMKNGQLLRQVQFSFSGWLLKCSLWSQNLYTKTLRQQPKGLIQFLCAFI